MDYQALGLTIKETGVADPNVFTNDIGNNIHEITTDIDQYYGFPKEQMKPSCHDLETRWICSCKTATMGYIFYPVYPVNGGFQAAIFKSYDNVLVHLNDIISIEAQITAVQQLNFMTMEPPHKRKCQYHTAIQLSVNSTGDRTL